MSISEVINCISNSDLNPIIKNLATEFFIKNLSSEMQNGVRSAKSTIIKNSSKNGYKCNHCGCNENSCYSHEITEGVFLKHISNAENKVLILKFDLRENPISYALELTHTRNAVNFPGYCSQHDASLFIKIETNFSGINDEFINLQCLRSTKRNLFDIERNINILSSLIDKIRDATKNLNDSDDSSSMIRRLSEKIRINELKKERASNLYDKIHNGISSGDLFLSYDSYNQNRKGYCFSSLFDLTIESDINPFTIFLIKLEHSSFSKFFICYPREITNSVRETFPFNDANATAFMAELMHTKKENFAFSE